jgi:hypothetical protein
VDASAEIPKHIKDDYCVYNEAWGPYKNAKCWAEQVC